VIVLAGAAFGALASTVNRAPGLAVLSKILGVGWSWAALAILVGAVANRRRTLAVIAVLVAAVAGYYLSDLAAGTYNTIDLGDPRVVADPVNADEVVLWPGALQDFVFWAAFAVLVSWPLARIGAAARRDDAWGLAARLVVPLGAAAEMLTLKLPGELAVQPNWDTVAVYIAVAGGGIVSALVLVVRHFRRSRSA